MKKYYLLYFTFIFINLFPQTVVGLTNGEWPPYTSQNLKNYGVFSPIVSEAFELEGMTVEYTFFP